MSMSKFSTATFSPEEFAEIIHLNGVPMHSSKNTFSQMSEIRTMPFIFIPHEDLHKPIDQLFLFKGELWVVGYHKRIVNTINRPVGKAKLQEFDSNVVLIPYTFYRVVVSS